MAYWLLKSEPDVFSIDHLAQRPQQTEPWDGVRNYQARNFMRSMQVGDLGFFYHSNTAEPGIVGIVEIARAAYPDETALDSNSDYYDPRATLERWSKVDVRLVRKLRRTISLTQLREHALLLGDWPLLRKGNRLSVLPVTTEQWSAVLALE